MSINSLANYAWSPITIILFLSIGCYLTITFKFIQLSKLKLAFKLLFKKPFDEDKNSDQISGFEALATVLSGTIGTGNIAGVATAIAIGGPGAIFWMWVTAFFGMATKFASCTLAHKYRKISANGDIIGGPMVTLSSGLNAKFLAIIFAIFAILASYSTGSMVQANSVIDGIGFLMPIVNHHKYALGIICAILVGIVTLGGVKRIAHVASFIVPIMAVAYILSAIVILAIHYQQIPYCFKLIFSEAFALKSITGASLWIIIKSGVSRGLFSSEAGLGSAPIAIATIKTNNHLHAGYIGMIGPIIDTILICTITALIIIITGTHDNNINLTGAPLSELAFANGFAYLGEFATTIGGHIVGIGLIFFAYTSMIAWSYYGDRNAYYLFGHGAVLPYRIIFIIFVFIGACTPLELVWDIADIANIGMAIPNLISLVLLSREIKNLINN